MLAFRSFAALISVAAFLSAAPALAIWVDVPLEVIVDEAHLIVAGKVTKIEEAGFAVGTRKQELAVVEVKQVLKALPHVGKVEKVGILQPAAGGIAVSTDIRFRPGAEGVWLLTKHPDRDVLLARHPKQFQQASEAKKIAELVKSRAKLEGGKPVGGLVGRAELLANEPEKGPAFYEVRFSVKNVSDDPLTICDYLGHRPVEVQWTGPDGEQKKSNHYAWLARARLAGLMERNFLTLMPGEVKFLGPQSDGNGVFFQGPSDRPSPHVNSAEPGKQTVVLAYENKATGEEFKVKNVWTGSVAANPVAFVVE